MNILPKSSQFHINKYLTLVLFAILIATLYTFAAAMKVSNAGTDFIIHAKVAEGMLRGEAMPPHFLYQLLLVGIHELFRVSFVHASFIAVFIIVFVTFIVAYKSMDDKKVILNKHFLVLATCFLLLLHPITILFPYDKHLYFGYIASNVYHNPTILLLKVIALLHFVLLCKLLTHIKRGQSFYINIFLLVLLTGLTIITKPNYIIALLPALCSLFLIKGIFRNRISYWFSVITLGVIVPALILLFWQFNFFYGSGNTNSIGVGFFEVFAINSAHWTLVPKLIVSMVFPISVFIVMKSKLTQKLDFQLSALMLGVSLIYSYLLVDSVAGAGTAAGNFWWSAQIAQFLFLFVSIKSYVNFIFSDRQKDLIQSTKNIYFPLYIWCNPVYFWHSMVFIKCRSRILKPLIYTLGQDMLLQPSMK